MNNQIELDKKTDKINSIQALRAIAFIGIFLSHARSDISWSSLGVSIFFVLSGFLMFKNHSEQELPKTFRDSVVFSWNRISKLYLLHILTMCFAIVLEILQRFNELLTLNGFMLLIAKILLNITLLQTWIPYSSVCVSLNGVAWYLSVSLFLYFVFPYISFFIKKTKMNHLILISIMILLIQIISCIPFLYYFSENSLVYRWFMYHFPIFRLGDFFIGCCLAKLYLSGIIKKICYNTVLATLVEIIAIILSIFVYIWVNADGNLIIKATQNLTTLYIPLAVVWILLFISKSGILTKLLSNKLLIKLGDLSPYLFLIHYVITRWTNFIIDIFALDFNIPIKYTVIILEFLISLFMSYIFKNIIKTKNTFICHKSSSNQ